MDPVSYVIKSSLGFYYSESRDYPDGSFGVLFTFDRNGAYIFDNFENARFICRFINNMYKVKGESISCQIINI